MDPIQFRIDWDLLSEVLVTIVVLAFLIERALSLIVESKWFINSPLDDNGTKEILAFAVSWLVVSWVKFDALAVLFKMDAPQVLGYAITAGIVAGGSKGSIKLFQDIMGWKSSARRQKDAVKDAQRKRQVAEAAAGQPILKIV